MFQRTKKIRKKKKEEGAPSKNGIATSENSDLETTMEPECANNKGEYVISQSRSMSWEEDRISLLVDASGGSVLKSKKKEQMKKQGPSMLKRSKTSNPRTKMSSSILYLNSWSVLNKFADLQVVLGTIKPNLVSITETWLCDDYPSQFILLNGYRVVARSDRRDTLNGRGGGVMILAADNLSEKFPSSRKNLC